MRIRVLLQLSLLASILVFLVFPQVASAQFGDDATLASELMIDPNAYGTGVSSLMIPGTAFVPSNSATGYIKPYLFLHRTGGGDSEFTHALTLPTGALIENVTAYVADTSAASNVTLRMCIIYANAGIGTAQNLNCDGLIGVPGVSTSAAPGQTALVLPVNRTFLNREFFNGADQDTTHVLIVHLGAADSSTQLHSVRVQWRRQVTPAPAVATFGDVPVGSALHQFVEALVASGVTAGCGGGNFCPNATLTRGQMAVFMAKALGLHWAP